MSKIVIGTRGSDLALWQANYTKQLLEGKGHEVEIKIIETDGDRSQQWNTSFDKLEGKGFFTKELEDALLSRTIDVAVHSHKDLPTVMPDGLMIAGVSDREDPSDILIIKKDAVDDKKKFSLKEGAIVGTSSARRKSQLLAFRDDVVIKDLRGNVPTRIKKLSTEGYDAILLANAGLERLKIDLSEFHYEILKPSEFVPAPAQGVLAWQIHEDNFAMANIFDELTNWDVQIAINIERKILNLFEGGCQLPLGAYCEIDLNDKDRRVFKVWTSVADAWDTQPRQMYFESTNTEDYEEDIVNQIKKITGKKVFVSKNFREGDYLPKALTKLGFEVEGKSLIEFKLNPIRNFPLTDWVFFSSKQCIKYFFMQKPTLKEGVKFGCISKQTSLDLREAGYRASFIGQSTDTKLVGKQFASVVGSSRVLFPISQGSMRTIQWQFPKAENAMDLVVYQTIKQSIEISPETEVLVFTSPSNVEAYFEKNKFAPNQKAIAMGEATENMLRKKGVLKCIKPISFDDLGLFQCVLKTSVM